MNTPGTTAEDSSGAPDHTRILRVGIVGFPLGHSISPVFQQAAFDHQGLGMRYERWETAPADLKRRVGSLRDARIRGANVTVPHKESVLPLLDAVDATARLIGAVNTIVSENGRLVGYNTDAPGFLRALAEHAQFDPRGRTALILGAGGAARAVAFALAGAGVQSVSLSNRTASRAGALAEALRRSYPGTHVEVLPWSEIPGSVDLIVNTTTIGMKGGAAEGQSPMAESAIPPGSAVCDLVYNPLRTPLLVAAERAGARSLGGLPMLIYQGAIAFEKWTGLRAPIDVMFEAARRAL